jgi:putative ABC transport system substrate-binding protein
MKRRAFIAGLAGTVAIPSGVRAQQTKPVIGFLHLGAPAPNAKRLAAFRKGLSEAGFVEGQNVEIEFRWAEGHNDRLPELAADLVRRRVSVIVTLSATQAALAAKAATGTIPIVFQVGTDPVTIGLVASLNRPGGNATGISSLSAEIMPKRVGLLRELVPAIATIYVLTNPSNPNTKLVQAELEPLARSLNVKAHMLNAINDDEIQAAVRSIPQGPGRALVVNNDPNFYINRLLLARLTANQRLPAIYYER